MDSKKILLGGAWTIFSLLDQDFLDKVRLACVFGNLGNEAIVVTNEDLVYGIGSNGAACLGTNDSVPTLLPRKITQLCGKAVAGLACGSGPHVLAFTSCGDLYAWGHNGYSQLGTGTTGAVSVPTLIQGPLLNKQVVSVACGTHHSLALTNEGELFSWGQNNCGQVGNGTTANQATPRKISNFGVKKEKVVQISCGQTCSMALLESGEVFGWGFNGNGQLGIGNNINQSLPMKVAGPINFSVSKLVCGYAHAIAITQEGHLYTWGANSYGQLGNGTKSNCCSPVRIAEDLGSAVDIAASFYNHTSAAQIGHKIYMWGQCHGIVIPAPIETQFTNLNDVFAAFGTPKVTFRPIVREMSSGPSILDSLKMAFNDPETSDLKFVRDERVIYVHKTILKLRCEHFRSMFQEHWDENSRSEIEIPEEFSYPVYLAFLRYLYTDEVELSPDDAVELLDLATSYCELQLKRRAESLICRGITLENVALLYATALKFQAKDLEEFCFQYCMAHTTDMVQTEAFRNLDEATIKNFVIKAAQHNAFRH